MLLPDGAAATPPPPYDTQCPAGQACDVVRRAASAVPVIPTTVLRPQSEAPRRPPADAGVSPARSRARAIRPILARVAREASGLRIGLQRFEVAELRVLEAFGDVRDSDIVAQMRQLAVEFAESRDARSRGIDEHTSSEASATMEED